MTKSALKTNKIKIKPFVFGIDPQPKVPTPKVGVNLESVVSRSSQLACLVLSLITFELVRRNAYKRWMFYINQVGLKLKDLVVYLDVLHDNRDLVAQLKAFCYKAEAPEYDKQTLIREAYELRQQLTETLKKAEAFNDFQVHQIPVVRTSEHLTW